MAAVLLRTLFDNPSDVWSRIQERTHESEVIYIVESTTVVPSEGTKSTPCSSACPRACIVWCRCSCCFCRRLLFGDAVITIVVVAVVTIVPWGATLTAWAGTQQTSTPRRSEHHSAPKGKAGSQTMFSRDTFTSPHVNPVGKR